MRQRGRVRGKSKGDEGRAKRALAARLMGLPISSPSPSSSSSDTMHGKDKSTAITDTDTDTDGSNESSHKSTDKSTYESEFKEDEDEDEEIDDDIDDGPEEHAQYTQDLLMQAIQDMQRGRKSRSLMTRAQRLWEVYRKDFQPYQKARVSDLRGLIFLWIDSLVYVHVWMTDYYSILLLLYSISSSALGSSNLLLTPAYC